MQAIKLNENFWDCECKEQFIHSKNFHSCKQCHAIQKDQPDSRESEIKPENMGYLKSLTTEEEQQRLRIESMKKDIYCILVNNLTRKMI